MNYSKGHGVRTRHLRVEKTKRFRADCCICVLMVFSILSFAEQLGWYRCVHLLLPPLLVPLFTTWLEAYEHFTAQLQEIRICILLANIYAFVCGAAISVLCSRTELLALHAGILVVQTGLMLVVGQHLYRHFHNHALYRNPSLLVVAAKGNEARLRRLKYGVLSDFDAWYTEISSDGVMDEAEWSLLQTQLAKSDALCVFDNIRGSIYDRLLYQTMKQGKEVYVVPRIIGSNINHSSLTHFDDIPVLYLENYELTLWNRFWKRLLDLVVSLAALALTLLPMAIIAVCIKLDSPGPVIYRQERYTKDRRVFQILKFRTMIPNAEKLTGPVFAQKNDPRITKTGRILRRFRLDELPQIFNILKGDMSLVGPRPERPFFVEQFEKEVPQYSYRFAVKAGLTALSHVYGRYSTYICDRTYYDLRYITSYSFLLDIRILLLTGKTLFLPKAAEGEDEFRSTIQTGSR